MKENRTVCMWRRRREGGEGGWGKETERQNEMKIKHCMSGKGHRHREKRQGRPERKEGEKTRKKEKTFSGTLDSWLDKEGGC